MAISEGLLGKGTQAWLASSWRLRRERAVHPHARTTTVIRLPRSWPGRCPGWPLRAKTVAGLGLARRSNGSRRGDPAGFPNADTGETAELCALLRCICGAFQGYVSCSTPVPQAVSANCRPRWATLVKPALGIALAMGVLTAGQAQAFVVNVNGQNWDLTTFTGPNDSNVSKFATPANGGAMPWWGQAALAGQFANAVRSNLPVSDPAILTNWGPIFRLRRECNQPYIFRNTLYPVRQSRASARSICNICPS